MHITQEQFNLAFRGCKEKEVWYSILSEELSRSTINTPLREAHFLAQCAHESSEFNVLSENLNYSRDGLLKIFSKYFTPETAAQYARKPEKIASRVYANRMGNGNEASGDGWKYRGAGIIQLTGKQNYRKCSHALFEDDVLLNDPGMLRDKRIATRAAIWFWESNNINKYADVDDAVSVTKRINGGTIGLAHRLQLLSTIKKFTQ